MKAKDKNGKQVDLLSSKIEEAFIKELAETKDLMQKTNPT
jgi:hypothetical protein